MVERIFSSIFCLLMSLFVAAAADAAPMARGFVFHDKNGNNTRDDGEPGVSGVKVSNGLEVVATDQQGRYELPVTDETILFVVKPRHWQTRIDAQNLPRFYYIHKPSGSPDERFVYKGVAPTGPLPDSVDFPLTPARDGARFRVLLLGDPQPYSRQDLEFYARDVISEVAANKREAAFAIALGDLVGDDLALFEPLNDVQAAIGIPVYNVYGNHDMNFMSPDDQHADETFERVYGPSNYIFQYGSVHFILLDNVFWKGFTGLTERGKPQNGNYEGHLRDDQLQLIENYLRHVPRGERIVLCMHIPLINPYSVQHSTPQLDRLLEILSPFPHTLSFSGHTHVNGNYFRETAENGRSQTSAEPTFHRHHNVGTASGSWYRGPLDAQGIPLRTMADGTPPGYALAEFEGAEYSVRWKCTGRPAGYQMEVHLPETISATSSTSAARVTVNFFNGTPRAQVRMRIVSAAAAGEADWIRLEQTPGTPPTYEAVYDALKTAAESLGRTPLPEPAETQHLWSAPLPDGLSPGRHLLQVEAIDMHTQRWRAARVFDVQE